MLTQARPWSVWSGFVRLPLLERKLDAQEEDDESAAMVPVVSREIAFRNLLREVDPADDASLTPPSPSVQPSLGLESPPRIRTPPESPRAPSSHKRKQPQTQENGIICDDVGSTEMPSSPPPPPLQGPLASPNDLTLVKAARRKRRPLLVIWDMEGLPLLKSWCAYQFVRNVSKRFAAPLRWHVLHNGCDNGRFQEIQFALETHHTDHIIHRPTATQGEKLGVALAVLRNASRVRGALLMTTRQQTFEEAAVLSERRGLRLIIAHGPQTKAECLGRLSRKEHVTVHALHEELVAGDMPGACGTCLRCAKVREATRLFYRTQRQRRRASAELSASGDVPHNSAPSE